MTYAINDMETADTGSFFLIYGLWWMFSTYWIYFTQKKLSMMSRGGSPRSGLLQIFNHDPDDSLAYKSWIPQPFLRRVPLEPILKVIVPGLGVFVKLFLDVWVDTDGKSHLVWSHYRVNFVNGTFSDLSNFYHICIYSSFLLSGIVDLVSICGKLPRAVSQLFLCFAFYCETILYSFHILGRDPLNTAAHQFLLIFVISSALFATLRMLNPRNLFINAGFSGSMILQGTQFIQIGWLLYGGIEWNFMSHENIKFVGALAILHLLGVSMFMLIVFIILRAVMYWLARCKRCMWLSLDEHEKEMQEMESLIPATGDDVTADDHDCERSDTVETGGVKDSPA